MSRSERSTSRVGRQIKTQLSRLRRAQGFVDWRRSSSFASELESMLAGIRSAVQDPAEGIEAAQAFFESDAVVFEQCDDSSGSIGDVFRFSAKDLFVHYAQAVADKASLADLLTNLYARDEYGVRGDLIDAAHEFLPPEALQDLAQRLWGKAESLPSDSYELRHWTLAVESIARQLKDAPLFEKARRTAWPELSTASCLDIASAYLDAGDAHAALSWEQRAPDKDASRADERDQLLLLIHKKLRDGEAVKETAWRIFRRYHSKETLSALLSAIGKDQREKVIADETRHALASAKFSYSDAEFLIEVGQTDAAEAYLMQHSSELDGDFYSALLPLAQAMEKNERWLAAVVVYRALLESILGRGISKYYHHGVRYLKKLDALAAKVGDWHDLKPHGTYKEGLLKTHSRKSSFWSRYDGGQKSSKAPSRTSWTIVR